VNRFRH